MKLKLFGWVLAGLVALGAAAQPASAYDHYARYDYSAYDEYDYYGTYRDPNAYYDYGYTSANYGHVNYGARAWDHRDHAARTYVWKGRGTVALTVPVGFHLEPSIGAPVYGVLEPGTRLTMLGRGQGWAKVRSKWGTIGYIPETDFHY